VIQFVNGAVITTSAAYRIKDGQKLTKRPVKSFKKEAEISLLEEEDDITVFRDDLKLLSFPRRSTAVLRAWFNFRSEMDYDLVIQFNDLELVYYSISRGSVE
jgi:hypothetical protein